MDAYYLSKDEWDSVLELGVDKNNGDEIMKKIPGPVKSAFTRKQVFTFTQVDKQ